MPSRQGFRQPQVLLAQLHLLRPQHIQDEGPPAETPRNAQLQDLLCQPDHFKNHRLSQPCTLEPTARWHLGKPDRFKNLDLDFPFLFPSENNTYHAQHISSPQSSPQ